MGLGYLVGEPVVDGVMWVAGRAKWVFPALLVVAVAWWALSSARAKNAPGDLAEPPTTEG